MLYLIPDSAEFICSTSIAAYEIQEFCRNSGPDFDLKDPVALIQLTIGTIQVSLYATSLGLFGKVDGPFPQSAHFFTDGI